MLLLPTASYLVLPDVHQNIRWVETVLERELAHVDGIVFLGDYFDPKLNTAASADRVAEFFLGLPEQLGKPTHFLVGNHDLPYLYDLQCRWQGEMPIENPYRCSGYMPERSRWIAKFWDQEFCSRLQPILFANRYALTHAGLHRRHFEGLPAGQEPTFAALELLAQRLKVSLDNLQQRPEPQLFAIAPARGGADPVGSVTWLDWNDEFEDDLPWPQLIGHTVLNKAQRKGRSWNLDSRTCHYAILTPRGVDIRKS